MIGLSTVKELHMKAFFNFLEKKAGKKPPIVFDLLYNPENIGKDDILVNRSFELNNPKATFLPDNLIVWNRVDIAGSSIDDIPKNLRISGNLIAWNTPLAEKYNSAQIRKMIVDRGGYIKGMIYLKDQYGRDKERN